MYLILITLIISKTSFCDVIHSVHMIIYRKIMYWILTVLHGHLHLVYPKIDVSENVISSNKLSSEMLKSQS